MTTSFQVTKLFGIPIRLDLSLLVLMGLIWFYALLATQRLLSSFLWGGSYAFLLLLSIVLHEISHSLVSMRFGCRVRGITLMLIGGRAELSHLPTRPVEEFCVAIAGPLVSLGLWLAGHFGATLIDPLAWPGISAARDALLDRALHGPPHVSDLLVVLGVMNF